MNRFNSHGFGWSFAGHLAAALLAVGLGMAHGVGCQRRRKDIAVPIKFLVDTQQPIGEPEPESPAQAHPALEAPRPSQPAPEPTDEPLRRPDIVRPHVVVSTNVVRRILTPNTPPRPSVQQLTEPQVSAEDFRRLPPAGTPLPDGAAIASEDERALAILRTALHAAWIKPTIDQRGRRPAQLGLSVDRFGVVTGRRLTQSSGSPAMDASVERAGAAVRQVRNLPPGFVARFPTVFIEFELE